MKIQECFSDVLVVFRLQGLVHNKSTPLLNHAEAEWLECNMVKSILNLKRNEEPEMEVSGLHMFPLPRVR